MGRPRKSQQTPEWSGMPNNSGALLEIKTAIEQTHPCFNNLEIERVNITDIFEDLHTKYGIPRRVFNFLAKSSYYGTADVVFDKNSELQDAWEALGKVNNE